MPRGEKGTARPYLRGEIWWIKYCVPGEPKPRRESSKSTNKNDAVRLLNQRRKQIDDRQVTSSNAVVADLLKLYLEDQKRQGCHSYKQAEGYVRLHLAPAFGKMRAGDLTTKHINSFIDQKRAVPYAKATVNRWLEALRRSYTLGLEHLPPLIYVAPDIKSRLLDESDNVREGFLEHEDYLALRRELPDHLKLVLVIGYHYGMRRGEILSLQWDQVDWRGNVIRLKKLQTKAKRARIAPLYGELRGWLEMAKARDPDCRYIVSWRGEGIETIKTAWNKARKRAGVPELLVHDLRRTAARNMIRAGVSEKQTMETVGWKSRNMFDRYNIIDERDVIASGMKMDSFHAGLQDKVGTEVGTVAEKEILLESAKPLQIQ